MEIEYRNLLPQESKMYRTIRLESLKQFPNSFGADYQEALHTEKLRLENDIENQLHDRFVLGAFSNGELVGICAFVKDENNTGNIYQMYVKESHQGKNIGSKLVKSIINEAYHRFDMIDVFLEVTYSNANAYYVYKKLGFKEVSNPTTVKEGDANIMMKYYGN